MGSQGDQVAVRCLLFSDVQNMQQVKALILQNQLQAAVVDPRLIFHPHQLLLAAHKCLYDSANQQAKTRTVHTELLYCLYPGRGIREALETVGAQATSTDVLFVTFDQAQSQRVLELVEGRLRDFGEIKGLADLELVRKVYRIADELEREEDVLNCVLTKIAAKELLM